MSEHDDAQILSKLIQEGVVDSSYLGMTFLWSGVEGARSKMDSDQKQKYEAALATPLLESTSPHHHTVSIEELHRSLKLYRFKEFPPRVVGTLINGRQFIEVELHPKTGRMMAGERVDYHTMGTYPRTVRTVNFEKGMVHSQDEYGPHDLRNGDIQPITPDQMIEVANQFKQDILPVF